MRALTVRQPFAWAIIHGGKDVENRTRNIAGSYRGPVAIHAGLAPFEQRNMASRAHRAACGSETPAEILFGAIIGVVDLVDVHLGPTSARMECCWRLADVLGWVPADGRDDLTPRICSTWAQPDHYHLVLANPRPLAVPIPYRGRLGLWTLPDEVSA